MTLEIKYYDEKGTAVWGNVITTPTTTGKGITKPTGSSKLNREIAKELAEQDARARKSDQAAMLKLLDEYDVKLANLAEEKAYQTNTLGGQPRSTGSMHLSNAAIEGAKWSNVYNTFKQIGSNFLNLNLTKSINVAPKYQGTLLGKIGSFLTKPATIAAAAVAPLAIRSIPKLATAFVSKLKPVGAVASKGSKYISGSLSKASKGLIKLGGASALRKTIGTGLLAYGGYSAVKGITQSFSEGGVKGLLQGTPKTNISLPNPIDPDNPITIGQTGSAPFPNISYVMNPSGEYVPVIIGANGQAIDPTTGEIVLQGTGSGSGSIGSEIIEGVKALGLPLAVGLVGYALLKKR